MPKGKAGRCQSMISFNVERKPSDKIIARTNKRARQEIEDTSATLLVNQASTSSVTEETTIVNVSYFSP